MVNPCWGDYIIVKKSGKKFKLSEIKDLQLKYKNNELHDRYLWNIFTKYMPCYK